MADTTEIRRLEVLGTYVDAMDQDAFFGAIAAAIAERRRMLITNHNVNSLAILRRQPALAALFEGSDLIFVDGMAVVPLARALGRPLRKSHRLAVLDWIWPLFSLAEEHGWRVVHLGSTPEVIARAEAEIRRRTPRLEFTAISGFFDARRESAENREVLERIAAARPHILLVGMGMPRQERWVQENLDDLPCVVITVGGILGFLGGDRPTPPRWLGPLGVEWLYRLVTEPRRLWRRYLVEPAILLPVILDALAGRARRGARRARRRIASGMAGDRRRRP